MPFFFRRHSAPAPDVQAPAPDAEAPVPGLRGAVNAVMHGQLGPLAAGLGVLYLVFAVSHPFTLPPRDAAWMTGTATATALLMAALWRYARRLPPESDRVHAVGGVTALLVLSNSVLHFYLTAEPRQTTNILLIVVAVGFIFLSTRWYSAVLAVCLGAWLWLIALLPPSAEWVHYGFAMFEAVVISLVVHVIRVRTTVRAERLRLKEGRRRAALQRAKEAAEEMARLKSAFLANMSHEIRTPLTSIIGFAEVMRDGDEPPYRDLSAMIHESGLRLLETLNSVLDFARLEASQTVLDAEVMDVAAAVPRGVQVLEPLARRKGLTLSVEIRAAPAWARLDPGALQRMLNNLVGNAVKFTERGGVTVAVGVTESAVQVQVVDTGVGIAPDFLPHLFDDFRQESTGISRSHEGSGLGLAITRRLVELSGGTVEVTSEKGRGSTFTLAFPRVPAAAENPDDAPAA